MPRIDAPDDLSSWRNLCPDMADGWRMFGDAVSGKSRLPLRIRELARMCIALANACTGCQNGRDPRAASQGIDEAFYQQAEAWRTWHGYSERERLAAEYAERIALDHEALREDDAFWERFRAQYSDAEIVDLAFCCILWLGTGRTVRTLDLGQVCTL